MTNFIVCRLAHFARQLVDGVDWAGGMALASLTLIPADQMHRSALPRHLLHWQ